MSSKSLSTHQDRAAELRNALQEKANEIKGLSDAFGDKEWLEDRFTIGDLIMVTVLRQLRGKGILEKFPNVDAFVKRGEARPAFQRALADQLTVFAANQPQTEGAAA